MKRIVFVLPIVFLLIVGVVSLIQLSKPPESKATLFTGKPRPAPMVTLETLEGGTFKMADHLGKPMIVNIWATWCAPCKIEHPVLLDMSETLPIVGLSYKDKPEDIRALLSQEGDPFAHHPLDQDGQTSLGFGLASVPETFLIDAEGTIVRHHKGVITPDEAAIFLAAYDALNEQAQGNEVEKES